MRIIQIVPRLPPAVDGVGDYAFTLAQNLRDHYGVQTTFVVCDPSNTEAGSRKKAGLNPVTVLPRRSVRALVETVRYIVPKGPILLHYVQYGFASKGCPLWLERGLRVLCSGDQERTLLTMFHELYAPGHFPDSAFWLKPVQKTIARRLALLSSVCVTSREAYARELSGWLPGSRTRVANFPIPSGVGENSSLPEFQDRRREMVVFGLSATRAKAYQMFAPDLECVCNQLGIKKIVDIGPRFAPMPLTVGRLSVEARGTMPKAAISTTLAMSMAGFLTYDLAYLGRSSVFAAYCAHGLIPVCVHTDRKARATNEVILQDNLQSGVHFWDPYAAVTLNPAAAQVIAMNARTWYQGHDQRAHAEYFSGLVRNS